MFTTKASTCIYMCARTNIPTQVEMCAYKPKEALHKGTMIQYNGPTLTAFGNPCHPPDFKRLAIIAKGHRIGHTPP